MGQDHDHDHDRDHSQDTVEIIIDWAAAEMAGRLLGKVRIAVIGDSARLLAIIGGLLVSEGVDSQRGWAQLSADDMRTMMGLGKDVSSDQLVVEIVKAGQVVTQMVTDQLILLYRTRE